MSKTATERNFAHRYQKQKKAAQGVSFCSLFSFESKLFKIYISQFFLNDNYEGRTT
jgi:hypothetical protein